MRSFVKNIIPEKPYVTLTAYLWDDSAFMLNGQKRPAVIICPGGAYMGCSDIEGEPIALRFAAMGYQTFVLRYSNYGKGKFYTPRGEMVPDSEVAFPAPMQDIGRAFLEIREHADEWLVDQDRVAICGFSAGAHNCAMYSVYWDKDEITGYFGKDKEYFRPTATILGYTLSDYVYMQEAKLDDFSKAFFASSNISFFGKTDVTQEELLNASPARLVSASTPPMFIWATSEDDLVPVQHSYHMAMGLADKGIPHELHVFEKGAHGMALGTQASAAVKSNVDRHLANWVNLADEWLERRMGFRDKLPDALNFEELGM